MDACCVSELHHFLKFCCLSNQIWINNDYILKRSMYHFIQGNGTHFNYQFDFRNLLYAQT